MPADLLYGPDNTVSFRCLGPARAEVQQCHDNHRLDLEALPAARRCVRFCPREGRQPADNDPTGRLYYECLNLGASTMSQPVLKACPEQSVFDARVERCRQLKT